MNNRIIIFGGICESGKYDDKIHVIDIVNSNEIKTKSSETKIEF